nr:MAG TPA_asm: hypothetical protein [Caudoviricetes sp.]DAW21074.1 MAG TPA: hypothetical protein [Caudoviricetes sp.]
MRPSYEISGCRSARRATLEIILLPIKPYMNKTDRNEQKHYH